MFQRIPNSDSIRHEIDGVVSIIPPGHWMWPADESQIQDAPAMSEGDFQAAMLAGVDRWLDETVQARGYESIVTAVSYAGDPDETFNAEGSAARAWRSAVYRRLYELQANTPPDINSINDLIAELPKPEEFGW